MAAMTSCPLVPRPRPPAPRRPGLLARAVLMAAVLGLTPSACAQTDGPAATRGDGAAGTRADDVVLADSALAPGDGAPPGADAPAGDDPGAGPSAAALGNYLAARAAQFDNDLEAAATHYARALAADPHNLMLMRRAYFFLVTVGRFDAAVEIANRTLKTDPGEDFAPVVLATDAMRQDRYADARAILDGLEPQGLNGLLHPLVSAWAALADGADLDAATAMLAPARQLSSARRLVDLHSAMLAHVAARPAQAQARLARYLEAGPPRNTRPLELVVSLLLAMDRADEAKALIDAFRAAGPSSLTVRGLAERLATEGADTTPPAPVDTARRGYAEALYHVGLVLNQGQGSDTSIFMMRLAGAVDPGFTRAGLAIAETLRRMERFEAANQVLSELNTADNRDLDYLKRLYRAENLENLERFDEALRLYDVLAEDWPDEVEPLVDKGDLLRRNERFEEAARAYGRALDRMAPDDEQRWPVLYRRGIAHERSKAWPQAEADFLRALDLEPEQPEVLNYLGYSWLDRGENIERAVGMIREAVRQRPDDGYIVDSLGWGYYLLGRYQDAVQELERAVELRPQDTTINDHLGDAYWRVGRRAEARFQWERALSLEPGPEQIETLNDKLGDGLPPPEALPATAARESAQ